VLKLLEKRYLSIKQEHHIVCTVRRCILFWGTSSRNSDGQITNQITSL